MINKFRYSKRSGDLTISIDVDLDRKVVKATAHIGAKVLWERERTFVDPITPERCAAFLDAHVIATGREMTLLQAAALEAFGKAS